MPLSIGRLQLNGNISKQHGRQNSSLNELDIELSVAQEVISHPEAVNTIFLTIDHRIVELARQTVIGANRCAEIRTNVVPIGQTG